jgi:hypothetical protein
MRKVINFVIFHIIFYLIGAFIAQDLNPTTWLLFSTNTGRVIVVLIEMYIINYVLEN